MSDKSYDEIPSRAAEVEVFSEEEWLQKMPRKLRIGAFTFTVELYEPVNLDPGHEFGYVDFGTKTIRLRHDVGFEQLANTFIHEVLHAIHWAYGLMGFEDVSEENYTVIGANGLCQFFTDNPTACEWWETTLRLEMDAE